MNLRFEASSYQGAARPSAAVTSNWLVTALGFGIFVTALAWVGVATRYSASTLATFFLVLGAGATLVSMRMAGSRRHGVALAVLIAIATLQALVLAGLTGSISELAFGHPPYENAVAAVALQGAGASLIVVMIARSRFTKLLGIIVTIAFLAEIVASGSAAGMLLSLLFPVVALMANGRSRRHVAGVCFGLVLVAIVMTIILGASPLGRTGNTGALAQASLSERRIELWDDAVRILADEPVSGVGLGNFRYASRTARSDADAAYAHNEYLQTGAETGIVGMMLLVGGFGWGFTRLAASPGGRTAVFGVAVASLTALAIHASIDYPLHFPLVVFLTVVCFGLATTQSHPHREDLG